MRFPKLVKNKPVGKQPVITMEDAKVAYAWELRLGDWLALTDRQRAEKRRDITQAPRFREGHE